MEEGVSLTELAGENRHDHTVCRKCKFWAQRKNGWCNYADVMGKTRLSMGVKLLPNGGCTLFDPRDPRDSLQEILKKQWASLPLKKEPIETLRGNTYRQMEALYRSGATDRAIAKELGISKSTVAGWRHRNNLESNYMINRRKE